MGVFEKYLLGYILLLAADIFCLSKIHPLFSFAILAAVFIGVLGYEGKRFKGYLEKNQKRIYDEYRRRTLTGGIWLHRYAAQHSKKSREEDLELLSYCRRALWVTYLSFPAFVILLILSLPLR